MNDDQLLDHELNHRPRRRHANPPGYNVMTGIGATAGLVGFAAGSLLTVTWLGQPGATILGAAVGLTALITLPRSLWIALGPTGREALRPLGCLGAGPIFWVSFLAFLFLLKAIATTMLGAPGPSAQTPPSAQTSPAAPHPTASPVRNIPDFKADVIHSPHHPKKLILETRRHEYNRFGPYGWTRVKFRGKQYEIKFGTPFSNDHVEEMRLPGKSQNVLPQVLKQICGTRDYARVRFTGDPLELKVY